MFRFVTNIDQFYVSPVKLLLLELGHYSSGTAMYAVLYILRIGMYVCSCGCRIRKSKKNELWEGNPLWMHILIY